MIVEERKKEREKENERKIGIHDIWVCFKNVDKIHNSVELPIDTCIVKRRKSTAVKL